MYQLEYNKLGIKIRLARTQQNLSQEELAEKCKDSPSFLGHIERVSRKMSLDTLVSIANALGLSTYYLLLDHLQAQESVLNGILHTIKQRPVDQYHKYLNVVKILAKEIYHL